jgi:hypothetical protein
MERIGLYFCLLEGRGQSSYKNRKTVMSVSHWDQNFLRPTKGASTSHTFHMPSSPSSGIGDENNKYRPIIDSNILELSFYRKQHQRSPLGYPEKLTPKSQSDRSIKLASQFRYSSSNKNYVERMKANAAIFVFLIFFVTTGIWLMNGLEKAFGPLH